MKSGEKGRWVAFDLDGTLHDFREAAGAASEAVISEIVGNETEKRERTRRVLWDLIQKDGGDAFVEGRSSDEYRTRRFVRLMEMIGVSPHQGFVARLVRVYECEMMRNLRLYDDARHVLEELTSRGYSVAIISEGPEDQQIRVIDRLGLQKFVKLLVTSSRYGVSKLGGLFPVARELLGTDLHRSVWYFGDSVERDIRPASDAGFSAVLVNHSADRSAGELARVQGCRAIEGLAEVVQLVGEAR